MRTSDLLKWKTNTGTKHVGKGADWETVYQRCSPESLMIWVKLNCLKSSGKLETPSSLDTTAKVKTWQQQPEEVRLRNPSAGNNGQ